MDYLAATAAASSLGALVGSEAGATGSAGVVDGAGSAGLSTDGSVLTGAWPGVRVSIMTSNTWLST